MGAALFCDTQRRIGNMGHEMARAVLRRTSAVKKFEQDDGSKRRPAAAKKPETGMVLLEAAKTVRQACH